MNGDEDEVWVSDVKELVGLNIVVDFTYSGKVNLVIYRNCEVTRNWMQRRGSME